MFGTRTYLQSVWFLAAALIVAGCRTPHAIHTADYAEVSTAILQTWHASDPIPAAVNPVLFELAGPHSVDDYVRFALAQNPGIQAARSRVEAAANRVPQAASLKDPMLSVTGWPFFPHVPQTASGRMTADLMVSQEVPWFGKLRTQAEAAEEAVNAARAQLAAVELQTIEQVKRAYFQLHFVEQAIRITRENRNLLSDVLQIADVRYRTGNTSQQDVLRLQAELSVVDGDLVRLDQELASARADIARVLHASPDTEFETPEVLPAEDLPQDLDTLYKRAVAARPELHAVLAEMERDRRMVELAHLEYRPDFTFNFGWGEMTTNRAMAPSADGIDNLTVGLMVNLPVYGKRLDAGVREAEAQVVATAREYDQVRDETLRDVKNLFAQARSQHELIRLFRESIIPKTDQALQVSIREYQVGQTEFVQMIDNWRELLRLRIMHEQLESQFRQTLASLARAVGSFEVEDWTAGSAPLVSPQAPQPQ